MLPGGQLPSPVGRTVVVVLQLHIVPKLSRQKPGAAVVVVVLVVVVVGPAVVVLSAKHGAYGRLVVPQPPPRTSPPVSQAVRTHSKGCPQNVGRTHPQGALVVVGALVDVVVDDPGAPVVVVPVVVGGASGLLGTNRLVGALEH